MYGPYLSISKFNILGCLVLPRHHFTIQSHSEIKMSPLWMICLLSESQYGKILFCIFHCSLYFWFLNLTPWFTFILILGRAKLASCCAAVQNFIVSQNNTPAGTNMSYEVESKNEILIRENIFNMFPVVSKDLLRFVCDTIPCEFSLTLSYKLQSWRG